eukprot:159681_1
MLFNQKDCLSDSYLIQYRSSSIILLRTFTSIIIPLIMNLIVSNECGGYWSHYWIKCNADRDDLNKSIYVYDSLTYITKEIVLLSSDEICKINYASIARPKCFRDFNNVWSKILIQKMIITIIMPFISILFKLIKKELYKCFCKK